MALTTLLLCAFSLALLSYGQPETLENHNSSHLLCTCNQIAAAVSGASQVFFPRECVILSLSHSNLIGYQASPEYLSDILHAGSSSTQASACSVEPGSVEDVSKIVRYLILTHQLLPTRISVVTYPRVKSNALCRERRRTRREPRIFLDERCTNCDVALQRDKSLFLVWDS